MLSGEARALPCRKFKHFALFFVLKICLLVSSGCAVGPDYERPQTSVPHAWKGLTPAAASQMSTATAAPVELIAWWNAFNDPVLTSLVQRAIDSNLDLRQARSRIRQARAARGVVAGGLWPQVDTTAAYSRNFSGGRSSDGSGGAASGNTQRSTTRADSGGQDLFRAGLDAAWELDIFGGVRRDIEASQADIRAAVEDLRDILVSLIAELGTNYVNFRGLQQQIDITRKNLEAQQHTAEITRKRFEAGFVGALDVANAKAQVATTESQIPLLESSAKGAIYNLSVLLGLEPAALDAELSLDAPVPTTPPDVPVGLPSDLLRRRPDIRRAEDQLHAATARIGVATADLFPKFSLTGSFEFSSSEITSLASWVNRSWSIGPSVRWPIFAAGRIRSNIEIQNAIQEQALIAYEQTVLTALKDVETALVSYAKEQQHRASQYEAVKNNRQAVDLAMKLYTAGRTDFLNVLTAQRSLYISEDALLQSTRNVAANLVALYKALGGGWETVHGGGQGL